MSESKMMIHNINGIYNQINNAYGKYAFDHTTEKLTCYNNKLIFEFESKLILNTNNTNIFSYIDITLKYTCKSKIDIYHSSIATEIENPKNKDNYFVLPSQLNGAFCLG